MPHSGLQSTIQLALHFGGVNATPGFLLNGWRKLFFHFDGMARAQLMNTLSAYCYCAAYYSRYRCTFLLPTFDLPQIYFDTVYEHCRFTFISGICAVCGYYCLIVDVSRIEKVLYIIAALFFWGFALVSFLFPFFF